eukprot:gene24752-biopygen1403
MWGPFTRPRYRAGPCSWGPNPRHMGRARRRLQAGGFGAVQLGPQPQTYKEGWSSPPGYTRPRYRFGAVQLGPQPQTYGGGGGRRLQARGCAITAWGPPLQTSWGFPHTPYVPALQVTRPRYRFGAARWVRRLLAYGSGPYNSPYWGSRTAPGSSPPGVCMAVRAWLGGASPPGVWAGPYKGGSFTRPRYRGAGRRLQAYRVALRSSDPYAPALQLTGPPYSIRGRTAGAPTPDIYSGLGGSSPPGVRGRCAVPHTPTGPPYRLRARATGRGRMWVVASRRSGAITAWGPPIQDPWGFPHTPYEPALQVTGPPYRRVGMGVASWRMVGHLGWAFGCSGLIILAIKGLGSAGPYNSPWGAHGHVGVAYGPALLVTRPRYRAGTRRGPYTRPRYRLRARATGRGRIAGAPTPDIWAAKPGSSPPGVWSVSTEHRRLMLEDPIRAPELAVPAMVRGRIAGGPTPDICGRCAVPRTPTRPRYRSGPYSGVVYAPALLDIGARAAGYGPALQEPP